MGAMEEDTTVFDYLRERLSQEPALWIWPLLFVAAIPEIVRSVKIIAFGQELRFDGSARTIVKNGGEQSFSGSSHKCVHDPTSSGQADGYHYSAPARIRCPESLDSSMLPRSAAISRANPAAAQASLFMLAIGRPIGTRPRFLHVADSMAVYPLLAPGPCTDS